MNLDQPTQENLEIIMTGLAKKLSVINRALLDAEDYDLAKYEDLKFMYDMVNQRGGLSPSETQAFIDELRKARK